jgi:hypothetical protein
MRAINVDQRGCTLRFIAVDSAHRWCATGECVSCVQGILDIIDNSRLLLISTVI